jgi:hypothetical protein
MAQAFLHQPIRLMTVWSIVLNVSCLEVHAFDLQSKRLVIPKVSQAPQLDGDLDNDPTWNSAVLIDDLHQISPNEYTQPSEKTEFYLMYDEDNLYFGAKVYYKNTDDITAQVLRQGDRIFDDDRVTLVLDPFGQRRSGVALSVNANGVRQDGIFVGVSEFNRDWDGIWDAHTRFTGYGWSTEVVIPYKTLSFDPQVDTWGVNPWRDYQKNQEVIGWSSLNRSMDPGSTGMMSGIKGIRQGMGLDIVPSISSVNIKNYSPADSEFNIEPSVDLFYKITPSLSAALTVNTDFSATEIDDRQVNLDRFSLFFPEKREFFLRDLDIFEFANIGAEDDWSSFGAAERQNARPFFSRSVGLSATGDPVDLSVGGKLSGRVGDLDVGALAIHQDKFNDVDATDLLVARASYNVLDESNVGFVYTNGDPQSNLDNQVFGVDFRYRNTRLGANRLIEAQTWYQQSDTEGINDDQAAFGIKLAMPNSEGIYLVGQYQEVQANFDPAMGFVSRRGVRLRRGVSGYTWQFTDGALRTLNTSLDVREWRYIDIGNIQTADYNVRLLNLENENGDEFYFYATHRKAGLRDINDQPFANFGVILAVAEYDWSSYVIGFETSARREFSVELAYFDGEYYSGDRRQVEGEFIWRPSPHFKLASSYVYTDIDLPEGQFTTRLIDTKFEWAFSSTLSWVNLVQYDNVSENLGFNSRLHWVPRAGNDVLLVYNHNAQDTDKDNNFQSVQSQFTLKVSYTFRF